MSPRLATAALLVSAAAALSFPDPGRRLADAEVGLKGFNVLSPQLSREDYGYLASYLLKKPKTGKIGEKLRNNCYFSPVQCALKHQSTRKRSQAVTFPIKEAT